MTEIGDSFRVGEVWTSPRGTKFTVTGFVRGALGLPRVGLRAETDKRINRDWDAVIGWVRDPEDNPA